MGMRIEDNRIHNIIIINTFNPFFPFKKKNSTNRT